MVRCDSTGKGARGGGARAAAIEAVGDALNLAESWKAAYVAEGWMTRGGQPLRARP